MDIVILDNLPFVLDPKGLSNLLRVIGEKPEDDRLRPLAAQVQEIARPKALYAIAPVALSGYDRVELGPVAFTSRVLRVNLEGAAEAFPFVVTAGRELEAWAEALNETERGWARAAQGLALRRALAAVEEGIRRRYPGRLGKMKPGSIPDWPLAEQGKLFQLLGDARSAIGVELLDSGFMKPVMTVSGIYFPSSIGFECCLLCPTENCPGRATAYDPGLFQKKYR